MTQVDRDRLVTLRKAKRKLITQREAAEEMGLSVRQVKRLLHGMKKQGDKAVIHGLRGVPSKRRIERSSGSTNGGRGGAASGNWCNGTPANMTGWRDEGRGCI